MLNPVLGILGSSLRGLKWFPFSVPFSFLRTLMGYLRNRAVQQRLSKSLKHLIVEAVQMLSGTHLEKHPTVVVWQLLNAITLLIEQRTDRDCFLDLFGCWESGEDLTSGNVLPSLLSGANVAGFIKVADAMKAQGDWW